MVCKNVSKYYNQILKQYMNVFKVKKDVAEYELKAINLEKSYALIEKEKVVSFIGVVEKTIFENNKDYTVVLIAKILTDDETKHFDKTIKTLKEVLPELLEKYDSVCMQATNWGLYDNLDLIPTTIKTEVAFIPGEYPTPMLMTWTIPSAHLIQDIESQSEANKVGVFRNEKIIQQEIELNQKKGLKFKANPFAYIWYDEKTKKVFDFSYTTIAQLTWLFNTIQPKNKFLLFKENELREVPMLKLTNKDVVVTKTFAKSKKIFNNIKFLDFAV